MNMGQAAINQATPGALNVAPPPEVPPSMLERAYNYISPSAREAAGIENAAKVFKDTFNSTYDNAMSRPGMTAEAASNVALKAAQSAQNAAMPGTFTKYGPLVATGMGAAYLGGAFNPVEEEAPGIIPKETGFDLYRKSPDIYGTRPGGAVVTYAPQPTSSFTMPQNRFYAPSIAVGQPSYSQRFFAQGGIAALAPQRFNTGGYASGGLGSMARKFPRRVGQIDGPGTGTSDSIPAMLSDGEFVMTAKAVRGAGKGSRREGAKRMYALMRKLERKA